MHNQAFIMCAIQTKDASIRYVTYITWHIGTEHNVNLKKEKKKTRQGFFFFFKLERLFFL
jgi:hypothetical protein